VHEWGYLMNRKRLLTILAGATAAMALQMGPAAAVDLDLGVAKVDTEDGLSVEADVELGDDDKSIKLDPKVKVGSKEEGTKVEGGASAGDTKVDVGETTEPVQDAVNKASGGGSGDSKSGGGSSNDDGGSSSTSSGGSSESGSSGGSSSSDAKSSDDRDVKTASRAQTAHAPSGSEPTEAMNRLSGFEFSTSGASAGPDVGGDVTPAFDLSEFDPDADVQEPLIAARGEDVATGSVDAFGSDGEIAAPETAAPPRADAELATAPATDGSGAVPAGLKLLAASLVAGTGAIWHVARRQVGLR
jgi:hypothetical protein